jgi:hypothetical protein
MHETTPTNDAERARMEQRRDRLMKLIQESDGSEIDSEDRDDLMREWKRLDDALNRR